jgi:glycosyltransferase involved in cell wall biosynthesis
LAAAGAASTAIAVAAARPAKLENPRKGCVADGMFSSCRTGCGDGQVPPGHLRLGKCRKKDVDARNKRGHYHKGGDPMTSEHALVRKDMDARGRRGHDEQANARYPSARELASRDSRNSGLRILHAILSGGFYGSERYCIDLAIAQARAGHDVTMLVEDAESACAQQFRQAIEQAYGDGVEGKAVQLVAIPRYVPPWLQRPAAAVLLVIHRPDIVHTHLNPAARRIGATGKWLRIPHVMTLHLDYDPNEHASISGLVALHSKQREQIPPDFPGEVTTIWNWLPSRVEAALAHVRADDVARLRNQWRADDGTIVFGSIGRLMPEKGMDVLIRAFRIAFTASDASVRLVIVGEGMQRRELEELARGDERIVLAGAQPDVAPYYHAFDAFVSAARFEPFGLAIIEAMGAGCPLIATSIHGTVEFVTDPRTLWVAPDRDGQLAVELCLAAKRKRARFKYDMARLTLARAVEEMDAFYRRVASRR